MALRLGDDQQAPEERTALDRVRDPYVQRLLEHDAFRNVHQQAVLPEGRIVRRELLVPADQRMQQRVVLRECLEAHTVRRALDLDAGLTDAREPGDLQVEHGIGGCWGEAGLALLRACRGPPVRVEAAEVCEAPVLVLRRRQRQRPVALEQFGSVHGAYLRCRISELPSGSLKKAILQTPESLSPMKSTPLASSSARAAATSATRNAIPTLAVRPELEP